MFNTLVLTEIGGLEFKDMSTNISLTLGYMLQMTSPCTFKKNSYVVEKSMLHPSTNILQSYDTRQVQAFWDMNFNRKTELLGDQDYLT